MKLRFPSVALGLLVSTLYVTAVSATETSLKAPTGRTFVAQQAGLKQESRRHAVDNLKKSTDDRSRMASYHFPASTKPVGIDVSKAVANWPPTSTTAAREPIRLPKKLSMRGAEEGKDSGMKTVAARNKSFERTRATTGSTSSTTGTTRRSTTKSTSISTKRTTQRLTTNSPRNSTKSSTTRSATRSTSPTSLTTNLTTNARPKSAAKNELSLRTTLAPYHNITTNFTTSHGIIEAKQENATDTTTADYEEASPDLSLTGEREQLPLEEPGHAEENVSEPPDSEDSSLVLESPLVTEHIEVPPDATPEEVVNDVVEILQEPVEVQKPLQPPIESVSPPVMSEPDPLGPPIGVAEQLEPELKRAESVAEQNMNFEAAQNEEMRRRLKDIQDEADRRNANLRPEPLPPETVPPIPKMNVREYDNEYKSAGLRLVASKKEDQHKYADEISREVKVLKQDLAKQPRHPSPGKEAVLQAEEQEREEERQREMQGVRDEVVRADELARATLCEG